MHLHWVSLTPVTGVEQSLRDPSIPKEGVCPCVSFCFAGARSGANVTLARATRSGANLPRVVLVDASNILSLLVDHRLLRLSNKRKRLKLYIMILAEIWRLGNTEISRLGCTYTTGPARVVVLVLGVLCLAKCLKTVVSLRD